MSDADRLFMDGIERESKKLLVALRQQKEDLAASQKKFLAYTKFREILDKMRKVSPETPHMSHGND